MVDPVDGDQDLARIVARMSPTVGTEARPELAKIM